MGNGTIMKIQTQTEKNFVLKRFYPHRQKISLLTYAHGRINVSYNLKEQGQRMWPGMEIQGTIERLHDSWNISGIKIIQTPCFQNHNHMLWLHHILELCYYFLPLDNPVPEVYFFLQKYYFIIEKSKKLTPSQQMGLHELCVIRFLILTGAYNITHIADYISLFDEITEGFIDFDDATCIEYYEKKITILQPAKAKKWIFDCLQKHPMIKAFKTVQDLY